MSRPVEGLRVVVTAGGRSIGRAIAEAFLAGGARVHICDIDDASFAELQERYEGFGASIADVSDAAAVDRLFDTALAELGGLDVLVNNAGIPGPVGLLEDVEPADWERTMAVNVTGQYLCARRAIPALRQAGGGSIVNIASTAGLMGYGLRAPYVASKWAVIGLTKTLAIDLGPDKIRVNAICPGTIDGVRMDGVMATEAALTGRTPEAVRDGYLRQSSLRTFIDPEDIAAMVLFICSAAGAKVTGQALAVDGHTETLSTG